MLPIKWLNYFCIYTEIFGLLVYLLHYCLLVLEVYWVIFVFSKFCLSTGTCCFSGAQLQWKLHSRYLNTLLRWNSEQIACTTAGISNKQTNKKLYHQYICMKLNNFFYTLLSYMHLAEWETNGARGCPDCFGISCRFISGTSWNNLVINFVASKWLSNTEGIRRSTSKNTMMRLCLTWKQSWWMPLTNQTACSEQNPWSALV